MSSIQSSMRPEIFIVLRPLYQMPYSVRLSLLNGAEFDVAEFESRKKAQEFIEQRRGWLETDSGPVVLVASGVLERAEFWAGRIATAADNKGDPNYATKAHMRAWAHDAQIHIREALALIQDIYALDHTVARLLDGPSA